MRIRTTRGSRFLGREEEAPARIDAGGARRRTQQGQNEFAQRQAEWDGDRKRRAKAAGRIPVLRTLGDVKAYGTEVRMVMGASRSLSFPAFQIGSRLQMDDVFKMLRQSHGNTPNVKAERKNEPSVGPHFDNYAQGFRPWTLLENNRGTGIIRAAFLPDAQFRAYNALAQSLPETDDADELLAQTRASIGKLALDTMHPSRIFVGDLKPGTRTLLWHGDTNTPPAVHDIQRNEPGDYTIYAIQDRGDLAAGFETIK